MSSDVMSGGPTASAPGGRPPMQHTPAADAALLERTVFEVKRVIVGQDRLVERMLVGLLAKGHVLLEGVPGVAKTLAVETFAKVVGGTFAGARLISSASRKLQKTGPSSVSKSAELGRKTRVPTRSEGTRSGVNWIRWKLPPST